VDGDLVATKRRFFHKGVVFALWPEEELEGFRFRFTIYGKMIQDRKRTKLIGWPSAACGRWSTANYENVSTYSNHPDDMPSAPEAS
jgi:hypothetical protein